MSDTYWLSFRLADHEKWANTYNERYQALISEIENATGLNKWWLETSSFFIFSSDEKIDQIAKRIKRAISTTADLVVVGKTEYKSGRVIGTCNDQGIFDLVPFMKKV